ncbi:olfactory receptor 6B1-like [Terrapene carolina triunguis]|uniref:olfactory receptor 6B1-like n=1 Tax=Terrapene triunguis TaxID=2587831 RepID=UPI001156C08B|nr:olfactory receptor 6B1-like [Terrapene carolina triunguis]
MAKHNVQQKLELAKFEAEERQKEYDRQIALNRLEVEMEVKRLEAEAEKHRLEMEAEAEKFRLEAEIRLMGKGEGENQTSVTKFILLGFGNVPELQVLLFLVFLVIYVVTMARNILIVVLVVADQCLYTPMYFFLGNLSCLENGYTSTLLPRMLASLLTGDRTISVGGCIMQLYLFGSLVGAECCLLAVMSYDRYLAICKSLHYSTIMKGSFCLHLVVGSWLLAFVASITLLVCLISQLIFCGPNEIDHFFCDFTPMIKLSCNDTNLVILVSFILCSTDELSPFLLTVTSYISIITTILRIPSTTGRKTAFSICSSHLMVVTIFYRTLIIVYVLPDVAALRDLNKVFSVFYTVLNPMVNPLIYSLRNREVKEAMRKVIQTMPHSQKFGWID